MKTFHLFKRSTKDLWSIGKQYYLLVFVQKLSSASIPFFSFIYMTCIVQALSNQEWAAISSLVIQYLVIFGLLQLVSSLLEPYVQQEGELVQKEILDLPYKKMLRMQFHYADSAKVNERLNHIRIANLNQQSSLNIQNMRIPYIIDSLIRTVWSIILLSPMLLTSDTNYSGTWAWATSPWILLAFVAGIIGILLLQFSVSKEGQRQMLAKNDAAHQINSILNYELNILHDIESGKEIRLYQLEDKLEKNQTDSFENLKNWLKDVHYAGNKQSIVVTILAQLLNYFTYAIIGIRVLIGLLPVGYIIQLSSALSQLLTSLPNLIQYVAMSLSQPQSLVDFYSFMDFPEEQEVGTLPVEKRLDNEYELSVQELDFTYPDSDELVLKDISLEFDVAKRYAIVGENGSGKTTFIKLLMRLYEPTNGEIRLNQIDAQNINSLSIFNYFQSSFKISACWV